jgi:molybdate transport system regulatory protein
MARRSHRDARANKPVPRAKVWLEVDGRYVFGHGVSEILKAVEQTGSIKAAAKQLAKSYRYVWSKIKDTERSLGAPLVHTQVGGGDSRRSGLTPLASDLIRDFDALRDRVFELIGDEYQRRLVKTLERHRPV